MNNPSTRRTPDIRQVAELAGVGIASVSRVLSGQAGSSAKMTERVLAAAQALGYRPNVLAQSLRRRTTQSIGFVVSDITNPLMAAIVRGAESVLSGSGFSVLLTNSGGMPEVDAQRIEVLSQRQVDGLMILPASETDVATLATLRNAGMPIVVIDRSLPVELGASYVLSDHYTGVHEAARRFLVDGHRRIGLAIGRDVRPSRERVRAVTDAAKTVTPHATVVVDSGTLSEEHGEQAMERFLKGRKRCTAVILGGNQLLEGALRVVHRQGIELGRSLSLVCCDDLALSRFHTPPIATVMRDTALLGRKAAEMLLLRIEVPGEPETIVLPTWFVARGSCGPLEK